MTLPIALPVSGLAMFALGTACALLYVVAALVGTEAQSGFLEASAYYVSFVQI
jgi:hypothetical protein